LTQLIHHFKFELSIGDSLVRSFPKPASCFLIVTRNAMTAMKQPAQSELRRSETLFSCHTMPLPCLGEILHHAKTLMIQKTQGCLSKFNSLLGC